MTAGPVEFEMAWDDRLLVEFRTARAPSGVLPPLWPQLLLRLGLAVAAGVPAILLAESLGLVPAEALRATLGLWAMAALFGGIAAVAALAANGLALARQGIGRRLRLRLDARGIHCLAPDGESAHRWSALRGMAERPCLLVLWFGPGMAYGIPDASLPAGLDRRGLLARIADWREGAA